MTRYLTFVILPYVCVGIFWFLVGIMHGQQNFESRSFDLGDALNLFGGGVPAACIGAVIERLTRRKNEKSQEKEPPDV